MTIESNLTPPRLPFPTETRVVGLDNEVLQTIDGALVLPVGARIHLVVEGVDAPVIGVRLGATEGGPSHVVLEVDAGTLSLVPASLESSALAEAEAEAEVVEAAEMIASSPIGQVAPPGP